MPSSRSRPALSLSLWKLAIVPVAHAASLSLSSCWCACPGSHPAPLSGCWCTCPGLHPAPHSGCWCTCPGLHPAPHSGCWCTCPGLHPAPHTLTLLNTTHGGRCNSSSRAGAAAADVQHLADAGPLHQWLIAGCSAVAGSMELFRWTGTPRRWSYWQCSIGQHRRCCCRCSSGRSQYFL